jgi:hypothetical protein
VPRKLSKEEAEAIIKKFCEPPYDPDEGRLREAAWKLLNEKGGYEFEADDEDEEIPELPKHNKTGAGSATESASQTAQATSQAASQSSSVLKRASQYLRQVISNIQSLGAAGAVAMSSATYFQAETVVDSTEQVSAIIQEVEIDYDQTFANYFVESVALAINDIPVIESIPVVGSALESVSEGLLEVADNMETVEEKQERVAQEQAEAEAKAEAKAEVKAEAEKQEAKEQAKQEAKAERKAAKAERQAEKESKSEEKSEQNSEEVKEEKSEPQQETEEQKSEPQNKESESRDSSQESAETQSESDVESEEASQDSSQDAPEVVEDIPVDQDMDEIKPHSMVQSDDAGGFIDQPDFPRVETPFDATTVSPNGPARPVSPVN